MDLCILGPHTSLTDFRGREISLRKLCAEAKSIEALLLALLAVNHGLTISIISADSREIADRDMLWFSLSQRSVKEPLAIIALPLEHALAGIPKRLLKPRPSPVISLSDTDEVVIDESLVEEYYQGFRIRQDPWKGERLLSPASLLPLILNCVCQQGLVTVTKEIIEVGRGYPRDSLRVSLTFQVTEQGWQDCLFVIAPKLEELIEKRRMKTTSTTKSGFIGSKDGDKLLQ